MKRLFAVAAAVMLFSSCNSPVDETNSNNADGTAKTTQSEELSAYLELAQNMEEPRQTHDEMSSKASIESASSLASMTTNAASRAVRAIGFDTGIAKGDTLTPQEGVRIIVNEDPETNIMAYPTITMVIDATVESDLKNVEDVIESNKTVTGMASWEGTIKATILMDATDPLNPVVGDISGELLEVDGWSFSGEEVRLWNIGTIRDSIEYQVTFDNPSLDNHLPGRSTLWTKLLEAPFGVGDTNGIVVDSLDESAAIQYGEGTYYNASLNRAFSYDFELRHRNEEDTTKPFENYRYNQAKVSFDIDLQSSDKAFSTLSIEIYYHVDRDGDGTADLYERDVVLTSDSGETIATAKGNVKVPGSWVVTKNDQFFQ